MRAFGCVLLAAVAGCVGSPVVERAYADRVLEGRYIDDGAYGAFLTGALAERSGDSRAALAAYEQAAKADPDSDEIRVRIRAVRRELDRNQAPVVMPAAGRERIVAATLTATDRPRAWEALATWAESRGDLALLTRALAELVRLDPTRRADVAGSAERLALHGHLAEARRVAAAAVDASSEPFDEIRNPLAARLAVDEAIVRGDADAVRARTTAARVTLEEAAGRAWLLGQRALAARLASDVEGAEPTNLGARLVLAVSAGGDPVGASRVAQESRNAEVSAATLVAFGGGILHALSPADARTTLGTIAHRPLVPGDERVAIAAAALASAGVLDRAILQPDAGSAGASP